MLTEEAMNRSFVQIWDRAIRERFRNGEINEEMDIQAIFRSELENPDKGLIGPRNRGWRCYHDIQLLKGEHGQGPRYDLVLMKYEDEDRPTIQYPAIVAEFKVWAKPEEIDRDMTRLENLIRGDKYPNLSPSGKGYYALPYALHMMFIRDLKTARSAKCWDVMRKEVQGYRFCAEPGEPLVAEEANKAMETCARFAVWGRYEGREAEIAEDCNLASQGNRYEQRQILLVRMAWIRERAINR